MGLIYPCLLFLQLRGTPADLPYRPLLLLQVLALDVALTTLLYRLLEVPDGLRLALVHAALHLLLYAGVLWLRSRSARFVQTALALFGMSVLFTALLLPPILVLAAFGIDLRAPALDGPTARAAALFLELVMASLVVWRLLAEAQALRHAVELPYAASTAITFAVFASESWLLQQWFPRP